MTTPHEHPDSSKMDAYLDGTAPDQARDAVSREIAASPQLQAEVQLQNRIDESLRTVFAPSEPPAQLLAKLQAAAAAEQVVA
jgi:anti-sigma factor RsiW